MNAAPTLFTVTVDTEEEWDWSSGYPTTVPRVTNIRRLPRLQDLCERYGAAVTYFTNHAVLNDAEGQRVMRDLAGRPRVEIGMHIHPWNTPPLQPVPAVAVRDSFIHNLSPALARAKLESVWDAFDRCGFRPTSFRGGRYSSGPVVQEFLRDRGFQADASVLPGTTWPDDGAPDYRRRGLLPNRLPGEPALWEIPLTLGFTRRPFAFWHRVFETIENTSLRRLHLIGLLGRLGVVRKNWLNFENPLGRPMLPFLRRLRALRLPCVCFTLHSSSLMAGGNGYTPNQTAEETLFATIEEVLGVVARWEDFRPATVTEVARELEKRFISEGALSCAFSESARSTRMPPFLSSKTARSFSPAGKNGSAE